MKPSKYSTTYDSRRVISKLNATHLRKSTTSFKTGSKITCHYYPFQTNKYSVLPESEMVSWAGGLRSSQLQEFADVVEDMPTAAWKQATVHNGHAWLDNDDRVGLPNDASCNANIETTSF